MRNSSWKYIIPFLLIFTACDDTNRTDPLPLVVVDTTINLDNVQYQDLRRDGGHVEISGGSRGIIIYRESSNNYKAFEMHSPYQYERPCAIVHVNATGFRMVEDCGQSQYNFEGEPVSGPAQRPLRQYTTYLENNGRFLRIVNEESTP